MNRGGFILSAIAASFVASVPKFAKAKPVDGVWTTQPGLTYTVGDLRPFTFKDDWDDACVAFRDGVLEAVSTQRLGMRPIRAFTYETSRPNPFTYLVKVGDVHCVLRQPICRFGDKMRAGYARFVDDGKKTFQNEVDIGITFPRDLVLAWCRTAGNGVMSIQYHEKNANDALRSVTA